MPDVFMRALKVQTFKPFNAALRSIPSVILTRVAGETEVGERFETTSHAPAAAGALSF